MRILIITRNLPPLTGGMERLNWHLADELSRRADVQIIGPQGAARLAPAGVRATEVPLRPLGRFLGLTAHRAWQLARRWRPGIVLAGSGLTAPVALLAARCCGARAVAYLHGLDIAVRHPLYRLLWLPALRRLDQVIVNSQATARLARRAGIATRRISVVLPGVSLPLSAPDPLLVRAFRERHQLGNRPLLLFVGRLTARKGLREFVSQALPAIVARQPEVLLVVIGDVPDQALQAEIQTPDSIREAARIAGVAGNLRFLGWITDPQQLACAWRSAAVQVFPVQDRPGDPEGFGMVATEAAVQGTATVAFAVGGVVDAVQDGVTGYLVPAGDFAAFSQAVLQQLEQPLDVRAARPALARLGWPAFGRQIARALEI